MSAPLSTLESHPISAFLLLALSHGDIHYPHSLTGFIGNSLWIYDDFGCLPTLDLDWQLSWQSRSITCWGRRELLFQLY